jgi:hypothetical protein
LQCAIPLAFKQLLEELVDNDMLIAQLIQEATCFFPWGEADHREAAVLAVRCGKAGGSQAVL